MHVPGGGGLGERGLTPLVVVSLTPLVVVSGLSLRTTSPFAVVNGSGSCVRFKV